MAEAEELLNQEARRLGLAPPLESEIEPAFVETKSMSRAQARLNRQRTAAVSICMHVLENDIDIEEMKRLDGGIKDAIKETKAKLEKRPKSKFLKAKMICLKKASLFHGKALTSISKYVDRAKKLEKEADNIEVELLNLPCDLDEGDHVEKCQALLCKKKGLRKQEANAKHQARLWYRMQTLHRRIHRFNGHIQRIRKTKQCPRARVDVYHHSVSAPVAADMPAEDRDDEDKDMSADAFVETDSSSGAFTQAEIDEQVEAELDVDSETELNVDEAGDEKYERSLVETQIAESGPKPGFATWEEDWIICLDRAERRVNTIRREIAEMKAKVEKLKSKAIPLVCGDKKKTKVKYPPMCPKPPLPPPPPPKPKVYKHVVAKFGFATAIASGDPHVDTWDGVHHDTMIAGWFTWVHNPVVHIQGYSQLGCMPASVPNTCLRAVSIKITPPNSDEWLMASWGIWPPQGHTQNVVLTDSTGRNINVAPGRFPAGLYLHNKFHIAFTGGYFRITPHGKSVTDPNMAITILYGTYHLQVTLPRHAPHLGQTNGLMGYMNLPGHPRLPQHVLRFRGGRSSNVDQRALCQRCGWQGMQTPAIFEWAATHVVTGPKGANPPLSAHQGSLKQQKYLNAYHQNRKHHALVQLDATINQLNQMEAEVAALDGFNPNPAPSKMKVFPSVVPKADRRDLQFCRLRLKKIFNLDKIKKKAKKIKKKAWWHGKKCLSETEMAKIKALEKARTDKIKKRVQKYHEALNGCLQDVKSKAVAQTLIKGQKSAKKQKKKIKSKQKKQAQKIKAKARAIKKAIKAAARAEKKAADPDPNAAMKDMAKALKKGKKFDPSKLEDAKAKAAAKLEAKIAGAADLPSKKQRSHGHRRHRRRRRHHAPPPPPREDEDEDDKRNDFNVDSFEDDGEGIRVGGADLHIHVTQESEPEPDAKALNFIENKLSTLHTHAMDKIESIVDDLNSHRVAKKACLKNLANTVSEFKSQFVAESSKIEKLRHKFSYADDAPTLV